MGSEILGLHVPIDFSAWCIGLLKLGRHERYGVRLGLADRGARGGGESKTDAEVEKLIMEVHQKCGLKGMISI